MISGRRKADDERAAASENNRTNPALEMAVDYGFGK
jgi:hypothetical protein